MATDSHGMNIELPADSTPVHQFPGVTRLAMERVAEILAGGMTPAAEAAVAAAALEAVEAELDNAGILRDVYDSPEPDLSFVIADAEGRRSWIEANAAGGITDHTAGEIVTAVGEPLAASVKDSIGVKDLDAGLVGRSFAVIDAEGRTGDLELDAAGALTDEILLGRWAPRLAGADALPKDRLHVPDAIHEWWIKPLHFWTEKPYGRLLSGAITTDGRQLIVETVPGAGSKAVVLNTTDPDDHSVPTPFMAGDVVCAAITEHERNGVIKIAIGDGSGDIESLATDALKEIYVGVSVSYSQVFEIPALAAGPVHTYWCFFRYAGSSWAVAEFTINRDTKALVTNFVRLMVQHAGRQVYMSVADAHKAAGNQTLRIAFGYNPNSPDNHVYYLEVDCITGAISSPTSPATAANIRTETAIPLIATAMTPMLADVADTQSRRMTYVRPGPYKPGVLIAEWDLATPDAAVYKVASVEPDGSVTSKSYGIAGPRVGYAEGSNYIPMGAFPDPCYDETLALASSVAGKWSLKVHRVLKGAAVAKTVAESGRPIIRPFYATGGSPFGVLYADILSYSPTSYEQYSAYLKSAKENR